MKIHATIVYFVLFGVGVIHGLLDGHSNIFDILSLTTAVTTTASIATLFKYRECKESLRTVTGELEEQMNGTTTECQINQVAGVTVLETNNFIGGVLDVTCDNGCNPIPIDKYVCLSTGLLGPVEITCPAGCDG